MFSYDTQDRKNRALLKVGASAWSPPQSLDATGQASQAVIERQYEDDPGDAHLGISIHHGSGQYILTKIVTIRPRFVVESFLDHPIYFRQPGSTNFAVLEPKGKKDILFLSCDTPQLCLRFGDGNRNKW